MRFLMTTTKADPPDEKLVIEMDRLVEEMTRKGVLLAAGGLDPVGTHVTSSGGKITVTDGPFTESKETISAGTRRHAPSSSAPPPWPATRASAPCSSAAPLPVRRARERRTARRGSRPSGISRIFVAGIGTKRT